MFVATFSAWVKRKDFGMDNAFPNDRSFLVEAREAGTAHAYAKRFEGLGTDAHTGLKTLLHVTLASAEAVRTLPQLLVYEPRLARQRK